MNQNFPCNDFSDWAEVSEGNGAARREVQNESTMEQECCVCQNKIEIKASIWTYPDAPAQKADCFEIDTVDEGKLAKHTCICV
jgi:hypothetical protein